jgi:hypothetical protein
MTIAMAVKARKKRMILMVQDPVLNGIGAAIPSHAHALKIIARYDNAKVG